MNIDVGNDYSVLGEHWDLRLKATSFKSATKSTAEYDFSISLFDGCINDELYLPSQIDDFDYYIAHTGLHVLPTQTYSQFIENCKVTWSLAAIDPDSGAEVGLTTK